MFAHSFLEFSGLSLLRPTRTPLSSIAPLSLRPMNNLIDCRDRTAEFFSTVQSIAKSQQLLSGNGASASAFGAQQHAALDGTSHRPLPKSGSYGVTGNGFHSEFDERPDEGASSSSALLLRQGAPPPKQQSQFTQAAQHIGRSIHLVTEKLEKLGKLAKQRSLFNDPASEINELTYVIKTDLGTLHNELEVLHNWVTANRDAANAASSGNESQSLHAVRNSTAIVDNLKQQLMSTTKSFQEVLQVRTNNLKAQNVARKQFEATGSGSGSGAGGTGGAANGSSNGSSGRDGAAAAVRPGKRVSAAGSGSNPFDQLMTAAASGAASAHARADHEGTSLDDADDELSFLTPGAASNSQLLQDAPQDQTDEYLSSRAQAVEDIEGTIVQLGAMYARLVHIVGMQEEITLRIDANMDQALDHMDRGQNELVKYYDSIAGGRWLIIKIFAVLLAFLVFFMVFVA